MTKEQLLFILQPFTGSLEIEVESCHGECGGTVLSARYELRDGIGTLVLSDAPIVEEASE